MGLISGHNFLGAALGEGAATSNQTSPDYGLDAYDGADPSDYLAFRSLEIDPQTEMLEDDRGTATQSGERHHTVDSHNDVSWEHPLTGKKAAGEGPHFEHLMMASGMERTINDPDATPDSGDEEAIFTPHTNNDMSSTPSATVVKYLLSLEEDQARKLIARGYRGNFSLLLEMGAEGVASGEGTALFDEIPESQSAAPTNPTAYAGEKDPMIVTGLSLTVGGTVYPVNSLEFSTNWEIEEIRTGDPNGSGTLAKVLLVRPKSGSRAGGSLDLVDGIAALADVLTKFRSGARAALSASLSNGSDGMEFDVPALQFGQPSKDEGGVYRFGCPFFTTRPDSTAGDNDYTIKFT